MVLAHFLLLSANNVTRCLWIFFLNAVKQLSAVFILLFAGVKPVTFSDWEKINSVEIRRGEANGKLREKILSVEEMLQVARA